MNTAIGAVSYQRKGGSGFQIFADEVNVCRNQGKRGVGGNGVSQVQRKRESCSKCSLALRLPLT